MNQSKRNNLVLGLRKYRVWHRYLGLTLSAFLLISASTGLVLAWKKDVDLIQPATQKGISTDLSTWQPLEQIATIAIDTLSKHTGDPKPEMDRLDVRPSKGIVKVLFQKANWEVQVDGSSGQVLSIAKRHSDWIENLHDGSIISDFFKLIYLNILGIGLVILILAGLWLWYGPKKIRRLRNKD